MSAPKFEEELLIEALGLPVATQRVFIEQRCGTDVDTAHRIVELLQGYQRNSSFLDTPAAEAALQSNGRTFAGIPAEPMPGDRIDRYVLREKIGEGGFGVVYLAEQEEPVRRLVALKIIRLGLDTREFIVRFEAERQALALMDHPNIARVFDAGATENGRPYLVMEFIRGVPITRYCDEHQLPVQARLDLFLQICGAIQHAHQKGVIHRDLKPSNILVEQPQPSDGGSPKVIDFGVAKATRERLTEKTLFTRFQSLIGTPAYTSPEQMDMSGLDTDTRSDIYSLGVLLYELLTGQPPFDREALDRASLEEMRRMIREVDPPRPSNRFAALAHGERMQVAQRRATEPDELVGLLRSDLDWIVTRCLEKDRTRRYDTANALAMDLRRFRDHEPVLARPPSGAYRLKKFARRHRTGVIAGSAIAIALIAGLTLASIGFTRAKDQQRAAEAARQDAEDLVTFMVKDLRPELLRVGRLPLTTQVAERAVNYFSKLSPSLNGSSTERNRAIALEALAFVRTAAGDKAAVEALWDEALAARQRAVAGAPDDPLIAIELAFTEFLEVAHAWPFVLSEGSSPSSPEIDARLARITEQARKVYLEHTSDREISLIFTQLLAKWSGHLIARTSRLAEGLAAGLEAEALHRELLARTPNDTSLYANFVWLLLGNAAAFQQIGQFDESVRIAEEALDFAERTLEKNPRNIELRENAAATAQQLSYRLSVMSLERAVKSEATAREAYRVLIEMDPANFSYQHAFALAHSLEAELLYATGRKQEAEPAALRFVELLAPVAQSAGDYYTLQSYEAKLSALTAQLGRSDVAREHLARVHEWHVKFIASSKPEVASHPSAAMGYHDHQAMALEMLKDWPEMERHARAMLAEISKVRVSESDLPGFKAASAVAGYYLGRALLGRGSAAEAVPILDRAAHEMAEADASVPIWWRDGIVVMTNAVLAEALISTGDVARARTQLETDLAMAEKMANDNSTVWWDHKVVLAKTEFLLATVLSSSSSPEKEYRLRLLEGAAAVLETHATDNQLTINEAELLEKIRSALATTVAVATADASSH